MTTRHEGRGADRPISLKDWGDEEVGAFAEVEQMPISLAESGPGPYETQDVLDALWAEMEPARTRRQPDVWRQAA